MEANVGPESVGTKVFQPGELFSGLSMLVVTVYLFLCDTQEAEGSIWNIITHDLSAVGSTDMESTQLQYMVLWWEKSPEFGFRLHILVYVTHLATFAFEGHTAQTAFAGVALCVG